MRTGGICGSTVFTAFVSAAAMVMTGCQTMVLESVKTCKEPHVGYWIAGATRNKTLQDSYAAKIAEMEFAKRKQPAAFANLRDLRAYKNLMQEPVQVSTAVSAQSPDLTGLPPSEVTRIGQYIAGNKDAAEFRGEQQCTEWKEELVRIDQTIADLTGKLTKLLRDAESALGLGKFADASAAIQQARLIDPSDPAVVALDRRIRLQEAKMSLSALIDGLNKNQLRKVEQMQKDSFGTATSSESAIKNCMALLTEADDAVTKFRNGLKAAAAEVSSDAELSAILEKIEQAISTMRGRTWGEDMSLKAKNKLFWSAYQYADERTREIADAPAHRKTALNNEISAAYGRILPAAMAHYMNEANKYFAQDAYGISLILCRMTEELTDYARSRKMTPSEEVLTWEKRCRESRTDAQKKIAAAVQRRVVIGEFAPKGRETDAIASMVYDRCLETLANPPANTPRRAWGVTVEKHTDKTELKPADYLIQCEVPEFHVIDLPPAEIERAVLKVYREIHEIPNPAYHPERNKDVPSTMCQQELYLYQDLKMRHSKRARIKMIAQYTSAGQKKNMVTIDTDFTGEKSQLPGVQLSFVEEKIDIPFVGPPRTAFSRASLPIDDWPKSIPPRLSPDIEILATMQRFAADGIATNLITLVSSYPVETFAAKAVSQEKLGNNQEAANQWGQCLEYCCRLTGGDAAEAPDKGWMAHRDRMLAQVVEFSASQWKGDAATLRKLPDIWSSAVKSVLALAASPQ